MEVIRIPTRETVVITSPRPHEVHIERQVIEVVEVARQGPPWPPSSEAFDIDLALLFEIAMLP